MSSAPRFTNGVPIARGKCGTRSGKSDNQEAEWRARAAMGNERFIEAQRAYQLNLADKIEAEMLGCSREERATKTALEGTLEGSKYERDLQRIRDGAGITETPPLRRADPPFTLGGVGPW